MAEATLHCLYCGGTQSPEHPACPVCGAIARFALAEAPEPAAPQCPRCTDRALVLRRLSDGKSTVLQCEGCHGCFVRVRDWSLVVDDSASGHPIDASAFVVPASGALPSEKLFALTRCPACHKEMDRFHFGVRSPAVVDVCDAHGMWLDAGELAECVAFAADVAKSQQLPPESEAEKRDDAAFEANLQVQEREIDRNADIARANFRADPSYRLAERWQSALATFTGFLGKRR